MVAKFTVDWENWNRGLFIAGENRINEPTEYILNLLDKHNIRATFYCLGIDVHQNWGLFKKIEKKHEIGCHGYYHYHDEPRYMADIKFRSPFWDLTKMPFPPSGGFFFRIMPLWYIKWAIKKSDVFWIHLHDLDERHPKLKNPFLNWKRHVGLKGARRKLERLLQEVSFGD